MTDQTALTVTNFQNQIDVPKTAPKPPEWMFNPNATIDDALPSNYLSLEGLQEWLDDRNAESRILTVTAVTCELLYDPEKEEADAGEWKPVLWFDETTSGLVINKSRGQMLKKLSGSPLVRSWAGVGRIAIKPGIYNGKGQIVITAVPGQQPRRARPDLDDRPIDDLVDDLFA